VGVKPLPDRERTHASSHYLFHIGKRDTCAHDICIVCISHIQRPGFDKRSACCCCKFRQIACPGSTLACCHQISNQRGSCALPVIGVRHHRHWHRAAVDARLGHRPHPQLLQPPFAAASGQQKRDGRAGRRQKSERRECMLVHAHALRTVSKRLGQATPTQTWCATIPSEAPQPAQLMPPPMHTPTTSTMAPCASPPVPRHHDARCPHI